MRERDKGGEIEKKRDDKDGGCGQNHRGNGEEMRESQQFVHPIEDWLCGKGVGWGYGRSRVQHRETTFGQNKSIS